ncbi:hypothetical protein DRQ21_07030 [Candidatus Fermentibacteria bacterium]|nr:MAG: hypothetical protein DRQ21_07030 [Candidatus Fermentibacteria bacterium]
MNNKQKRICPKCNYLGSQQDNVCPNCGISLISLCPRCKAPIRVAFAKFCYRCGVQFSKTVDNQNNGLRHTGSLTRNPALTAKERPENNQEEK